MRGCVCWNPELYFAICSTALMNRRKFTALIGSSSAVVLSGCNGLTEDQSRTTGISESTDPANESAKPSESSNKSVGLSINNISNIYANSGGIPVLNSKINITIENPYPNELDLRIFINISNNNTIETTVPSESESNIEHTSIIKEESEYNITLDGEIIGNQQYDISIDQESAHSITFTTPSIAQTYTPDGTGQNTPIGFGADKHAEESASDLLKNEQSIDGFGERLQNTQKIQFGFPDEFEIGEDPRETDSNAPDAPQCRVLDVCISGDLLYAYNQWMGYTWDDHLGFSVCAVNIWEGKKVWETTFEKDTEQREGRRQGPRLLSVDDKQLFYSSQDGVSAVNRETGAKNWNLKSDFVSKIFLTEDTLFASTGNNNSLDAINSATGERKWSTNKSARPLAVGGDSIIVKSGGRVKSINTSDGSVDWSFPYSEPKGSDPGLSDVCAHTGTKVFMTSDVGVNHNVEMTLACIDAQTGDQLWHQPISSSYEVAGADIQNQNNIVLIDDDEERIYVYGTGNEYGLQCHEIEDGELVWRNDMYYKNPNGIPDRSIRTGIKAGEYIYGKSGGLSSIVGTDPDFLSENTVETRLVSNYQLGSSDESLRHAFPPLFARGALFYVYKSRYRDYIRVYVGDERH